MKDLEQAMNSAVVAMRRGTSVSINASEQRVEAILSELAKQLRDIRPAWRQAIPTTEAAQRWKVQMRQAMLENGINTLAQIERGLAAARADDSQWWPSIGQVVQWCLGIHSDDEAIREALERCRARQYADDVEYATWLDVEFECKRAAVGKDFDLFKTVYLRKLAAAKRGIQLPSRNTPLLQNSAVSARAHIEDEIAARVADGTRTLTSIEARMAAIPRQKNRTQGTGETFKYRRSQHAG